MNIAEKQAVVLVFVFFLKFFVFILVPFSSYYENLGYLLSSLSLLLLLFIDNNANIVTNDVIIYILRIVDSYFCLENVSH